MAKSYIFLTMQMGFLFYGMETKISVLVDYTIAVIQNAFTIKKIKNISITRSLRFLNLLSFTIDLLLLSILLMLLLYALDNFYHKF